MDHPADIVVVHRVPSVCEQLWAAGEEKIDSPDIIFAEATFVIG